MTYNHKKCEDEDDAARMSETILRSLGYINLQKGSNIYDVAHTLNVDSLRTIAQNAERISRWARDELKSRKPK